MLRSRLSCKLITKTCEITARAAIVRITSEMLPSITRIEMPILQELIATGGVEDVRFLYERLRPYFPQLGDPTGEREGEANHPQQWRTYVQRAGRTLDEKREIERSGRGLWTITARGRKRVVEEETQFAVVERTSPDDATVRASLSHGDVQQMLIELGVILGHHAEREYEYYDVVWRASERSPRLTHVFEVQHKGSIDSALVKLKRAYEAQRSKPFLIVASERDTNRAQRELSLDRQGAFHEIGRVTTILSFTQLQRLHHALKSVAETLTSFFD